MLKACKFCGRIHNSKVICDKKPIVNYTKKDKLYYFRNSQQWQRKRDEIKERDKYLCQVCLHNLHNTSCQYTTRDLQVHHIQTLRQAWDMRLDNDNLISLCLYHHEMAESGEIKVSELIKIVQEQESHYNAR